MGIIWTIIIGFVAGVIAKLVTPGGGMNPLDSILTTVLGIAGAFVASWLGQALGWYGPGEGAGLIGAVVGAIIVLLIWGAVMRQRTPDQDLIARAHLDLVLDLDCYSLPERSREVLPPPKAARNYVTNVGTKRACQP